MTAEAPPLPVVTASFPSLRDRRVLVTGGGSGIGEAIVEAFAGQGARVAFVDIQDDASRAVVTRLADAPHPPRYRHCDLTDIDALRGGVAALEAAFGGFDILVNNAANDDRHALDAITPDYWDDRMAVNLRHYLFCAQAVAPGMCARGGGVILNLGSISWHVALPDLVIYQTAKAAAEGMTRALARDLGGHGIRVNTIVPGGVRTARQEALWRDATEDRRILDAQCLKDRVMPHDVAAMALFLASDDARMCTGHAYFVDAGWR
jgi:NAD(P)-dependent dehydrogenase (short-subunit alcohol dehydrogenase family)